MGMGNRSDLKKKNPKTLRAANELEQLYLLAEQGQHRAAGVITGVGTWMCPAWVQAEGDKHKSLGCL